jgi:hypothetical protein
MPNGAELYTFTLVTNDADEVMARLDNHMPAIPDAPATRNGC